MEPTQDKPVKKRRRWLIVAFVLVFVSLCSWWFWPRIDQRLVGQWKITTSDTSRTFGPLWLKADGTGTMVAREPRGKHLATLVYAFEWRVEGNNFAVLAPSKSGFPWWDIAMQRAFDYSKNPVFLGRERFSIDRSDAGTLQLTGSSAILKNPFLPRVSFSLTHRRIPE